MKCASVPSAYRNCILRTSVRTARNFSPARKVRSITAPSCARRSFVRTKAPPLPGLTCWNSRILKTVPSTSMWLPFLNWFVEMTILVRDGGVRERAWEQRRARVFAEARRLVLKQRVGPTTALGKAMLNIMFVMAELQPDQLKAGGKTAKGRAIKGGAHIGPTPFGYTGVPRGREGSGTLVPDTTTAPAVTKLFRRA